MFLKKELWVRFQAKKAKIYEKRVGNNKIVKKLIVTQSRYFKQWNQVSLNLTFSKDLYKTQKVTQKKNCKRKSAFYQIIRITYKSNKFLVNFVKFLQIFSTILFVI